MNHIRSAAYESSRHLPRHQRFLQSIFKFFNSRKEVKACFLHGSAAAEHLHPFSDLELGILCEDASLRHTLWDFRTEWEFHPEMQLKDAGTEPLYRVSFVALPQLHLHIHLFTEKDMPTAEQGPFVIAWDSTGKLDAWARALNWSQVVHEDEQFWAWTHFSAMYAARGEYHDVVQHLEDLRGIVQSWQKRLDEMSKTQFKKMGQRFQPEFLDRLKRTYCPPHPDGIKVAYQNLIKIQLQQRALIERTLSPRWTVTSPTISRIQNLSQNFMSSAVAL